MLGHRFSKYLALVSDEASFETLLKIFAQLLVYTSGDVYEALKWMNELDREYKLTSNRYGMGDFIEDLKEKGHIQESEEGAEKFIITHKTESTIRQQSLEQVFGKLKKKNRGSHSTRYTGLGEEQSADFRAYQFGDSLENIMITESIRNAQINHGTEEFYLTEGDLQVSETEFRTITSTVLMIDISHSMTLYGEDRITPAKNVAMALAELIMRHYPKDRLDIIVFGDDAWPVEIKDLPYLTNGPYYTNTVAGLELGMDILRKRKTHNKQIFMITDGKPTCIKEYGSYYKNSFGLDRKIVNKTLELAAQCRRLNIPITTFMIARDSYLQRFVQQFTQVNNGRAFYSSLDGLGGYIFEDYLSKKTKRVK